MSLNKNEKIGVSVAIVFAFAFLLFVVGFFKGSGVDSDLTNVVTNNENPTGGVISEVTELLLEDVKVGDGAEAVSGSVITVHYVGFLTNGTKFDSSVDRGQPFQFVLGAGQVIQGWEQGIQGMKVGGVRRLAIPASLAYGAEERGPIPANSTLLFEVELLDVTAQ